MLKIVVIRYEILDLWKNIYSSYRVAFLHKYAATNRCVKIDMFPRPFATGLGTGFGRLKNVWFKSAVVNCAV